MAGVRSGGAACFCRVFILSYLSFVAAKIAFILRAEAILFHFLEVFLSCRIFLT